MAEKTATINGILVSGGASIRLSQELNSILYKKEINDEPIR
jgi:hypothetical protein